LAYQAACFRRVGASGHGPRLHGIIEPAARLPMGALVVERIQGRPPRLPGDLPALAEAMAAVHSLPLPATAARPPLADHADPVGGAIAEIEAQARWLDEADLAPAARAEIDDELAWAGDFQRQLATRIQPVSLVLTDTHPGNFLIRADGRAVIVDLEKALYGSPATDLAHATLYSSTTWDPDTWADLSVAEVAGFYRNYLRRAAPELAAALRPWLIPMRRITLLRALTWCAKWQVLYRRAGRPGKDTAASTEDWSAENSDPDLIAHVAARVAEYLSPVILRRMRAEWLGEPSVDELT
ncbi:MAG TPA: aminoglycoside phosphotransferase family protein, partial [Kiloniellales bacterium]